MTIEVWADTDPLDVQQRISRYSGELAFDIGANAGQMSCRLAQKFDRVLAFEPCAESYEVLVRNVPQNVWCLPLAVGHDGTMELFGFDQHLAQGQLAAATIEQWQQKEHNAWGKLVETRTVKSVSLDLLYWSLGMKPDLLKVDVEGFECVVLESGRKLIRDLKPSLYIEVHAEEYGEALIEWLGPIYGDRLQKVLHPHYREGSWEQRSHWFLLA